jgi:hypothetical protein
MVSYSINRSDKVLYSPAAAQLTLELGTIFRLVYCFSEVSIKLSVGHWQSFIISTTTELTHCIHLPGVCMVTSRMVAKISKFSHTAKNKQSSTLTPRYRVGNLIPSLTRAAQSHQKMTTLVIVSIFSRLSSGPGYARHCCAPGTNPSGRI